MNILRVVRQFFSKLQTRLLLLLLCVGVVPTIILSVLFMRFLESRMLSDDVIQMTSQAQVLNSDLISEGYLTDRQSESIATELLTLSNSYSGRIIIMDSDLEIIKDTYGMYEGHTLLWSQAIEALSNRTASYHDRVNGYLILTVPIISYDAPDEVLGVLLMTRSTDAITRSMDFLWSLAIIADLIVLAAAVAIAIIASIHMTKPLRQLEKGIADRTTGIRTDELFVDKYAETAAISRRFEEFRDQMKVMDDNRAEFVSNVSHELKTPLTSMKVLADAINTMGEDAPIEMYREFMSDITSEIDHETDIINELLSLVRLDKSKNEPQIAPVNMNDLLEILLKRLRPIAAKRDIELVLESFRPVTAEVDEVQFSLAIMNLIENAIKYNNDGGWVHVSLNADHQYCFIRVEDNGIGIPEDAAERVFERFYRVDESHSRQIPGTGLGLAITYDAIVMHHGEIRLHSTEGEGTTFDVRLPLKFIKEAEAY